MKTKIIILSFFAALFLVNGIAEAKVKPYYSGDAINYNESTIVGTVNMGYFELFKTENGNLNKVSVIRSEGDKFSDNKDIFDCVFRNENGVLYVYLVDGRHLLKYDISDLYFPRLVFKQSDNSWDWYYGVKVAGGRIYTISNKGIKVWNENLIVTDVYDLKIENAHNLKISEKGNYFFFVDKDKVKVYDTGARSYKSEIQLTVNDINSRKIFNDENEGKIYVADDFGLVKMDFDGGRKSVFKHNSKMGYDADGLPDGKYVYFTDGMGVVKINKSDLKPSAWRYSYELAKGETWAMGLKVVGGGQKGTEVVIFANNGIAVLDGNLKKIAFSESNIDNIGPFEPLALSVDKNRAPRGANFLLTGRGFMQSEPVDVMIGGAKYILRVDANGRFSQILTVPDKISGAQFPLPSDVKVEGQYSGLKYAIGFMIE